MACTTAARWVQVFSGRAWLLITLPELAPATPFSTALPLELICRLRLSWPLARASTEVLPPSWLPSTQASTVRAPPTVSSGKLALAWVPAAEPAGTERPRAPVRPTAVLVAL